ncbi:MAG: sigma 54-interacting transcriptional regulator [Clostridiales bacterium]|nr:sigma 54-interacting transcriptional regulator [Clostridiales bacterium]
MTLEFSNSIKINQLLPILDSISDAVFIDDRDGHCLWCNNACEELYKIDSDDICGMHVEELEKMGIFTPSVTRRVLEEEREITIIHENKLGKRLLTTGTPIFSHEGKLSKVITTSRDITRLTSLENKPEATEPMIDVNDIEDGNVYGDIIAKSLTMQNVMSLTKKLATVNSTVLITGESGVGKGLIAKLLHEEGNRWEGPFVTVNCGAIPENLIESELFGYASGAFTGSRSGGKQGLFEAAQDGTIFLDEISELPLNLQVKLLQVIQEREITPVGGVEPVPVDVRVVSATNKDLLELVKQNKFREDLYYRLNVVPINVPPLRDRPEDILPLIHSYLAKYNQSLQNNKSMSPEVLTVLLKYPWPGNIRELQNIIERLIITTSGSTITDDDLPIFLKQEAEVNANIYTDLSLAASMEKAEREILIRALASYKSTRAIAKVLRVSQPTVVRKLHKHHLGTSDTVETVEKQ